MCSGHFLLSKISPVYRYLLKDYYLCLQHYYINSVLGYGQIFSDVFYIQLVKSVQGNILTFHNSIGYSLHVHYLLKIISEEYCNSFDKLINCSSISHNFYTNFKFVYLQLLVLHSKLFAGLFTYLSYVHNACFIPLSV